MRTWVTRPRLAMGFAVLGVGLMGVDILMTRNFFSHIGELMVASILCFACALMLDRAPPRPKPPKESDSAQS